MESVNIFSIVDSLDYLLLINMLGERELNDKTVNISIVIQFLHCIKEFLLAHILFETYQ